MLRPTAPKAGRRRALRRAPWRDSLREERQRQPDKKIHLVLDDRAEFEAPWDGRAAPRGVGKSGADVYLPAQQHVTRFDVLRVVVTNDVAKARQRYGACVVAAAPAFASLRSTCDDARLPCLVSLASDAFSTRPCGQWEAPADSLCRGRPARAAEKGASRTWRPCRTRRLPDLSNRPIDGGQRLGAGGHGGRRRRRPSTPSSRSGGGGGRGAVLLDRTACPKARCVGGPTARSRESWRTFHGVAAYCPARTSRRPDAPGSAFACASLIATRRRMPARRTTTPWKLMRPSPSDPSTVSRHHHVKSGARAALAAHLEALLKGSPLKASSRLRRARTSRCAPSAHRAARRRRRRRPAAAKRRTSLEDVLALDKLLANLVAHATGGLWSAPTSA